MTDSSDRLLAQLLAECSEVTSAGANTDACLARHPEHAPELAPLLATVGALRALGGAPLRDPLAAAQARAQFSAAAQRLARERQRQPATWQERIAAWWRTFSAPFTAPAGGWPFPRAAQSALLMALLVFVIAGALTTGAVSASSAALPGDFLYPLKTFTERAQWFITRDAAARSELEQGFARRRLDEARAVVVQNRRVPSLAVAGTLDAYDEQIWIVSGLRVTIRPDSQIEGQPFRGALVQGRVAAPGDGTLIALFLEVVETAAPANAVTPTAIAPTSTPTVSPTPAATPTPSPGDAGAAAEFASVGAEPRDAAATATPSRTPQPSATASRTPRPTATLQPTKAPTMTMAVMPTKSRDRQTRTVLGRVTDISGDLWTVNGVTIRVTGATKFIGDPGLGWEVRVDALLEDNGSYSALTITALNPPEVSGSVQFTDVLEGKNGDWWTIGGTRVKVTQQTSVEGDPQIGDVVTMAGQRLSNGEIWALSISVVTLPITEFEGVIEQVGGGYLIIDGHRIEITGRSQIVGEPAAGLRAHVRAQIYPNGQVVALVIKVLAPSTPTPTPTPWPTATATLTPAPTVTPSATPAAAEPAATPTGTPAPTDIATPEPTGSPTPIALMDTAIQESRT